MPINFLYNLQTIKVNAIAIRLIYPVFIRLEERQCDAIIWLETKTVIPRLQLTVNEIASLLLIFSISILLFPFHTIFTL